MFDLIGAMKVTKIHIIKTCLSFSSILIFSSHFADTCWQNKMALTRRRRKFPKIKNPYKKWIIVRFCNIKMFSKPLDTDRLFEKNLLPQRDSNWNSNVKILYEDNIWWDAEIISQAGKKKVVCF